MTTFKKHLAQKMTDDAFRRLFEEEKRLAELAVQVLETREKLGWSQQEVARRAGITQQQVSKVEQGVNCNMTTFLKVCSVLNLNLDIGPAESVQAVK